MESDSIARVKGGRSQRVVRQRLETPASRAMGGAGWETPLITPKFDPRLMSADWFFARQRLFAMTCLFGFRLPVTPGVGRRARPGEVVMSTQGSPIIASRDDISEPSLCITLDKQRVSIH